MLNNMKLLRALVAAGAAALTLGAATTASAATWSPGGGTYWTGDVTLKLDGGSPVQCGTINNNGTIQSWTGTSGMSMTVFDNFQIRAACPEGKEFNAIIHYGWASGSEGEYSVVLYGMNQSWSRQSPFGWYVQPPGTELVGEFTNGTSEAPSTITFDDQEVGTRESDGLPITMSGTLDVTTSSGGLMVLE